MSELSYKVFSAVRAPAFFMHGLGGLQSRVHVCIWGSGKEDKTMKGFSRAWGQGSPC